MTSQTNEWHKTACNLCFVNCGLKVQLGGDHLNEIKKVKGDDEHPISEGYICKKAARLNFYQNNPERLLHPMRRKQDGSYEQVDWDTAISDIASKLKSIKAEHGGERILYYGGGSQGNHLGGVYGASLRKALGVRYKASALSQEKTGLGWVFSRMVGGMFHPEVDHAKVVMFAGKNPFMSNGMDQARRFLKEIKKDPKRKLIVLDPRKTETADYADIHLAVKPGRDAWCMAAIVAHLVQSELLPMNWLDKHTYGYEQIIAYFKDIPVDEYAEFAGLKPDLVREAALLIGETDSFALEEDLGVQMAPHSTLVTYLNFLTFLLTGNYGKPGTAAMVAQFIDVITTDYKPVDENGKEIGRYKLPVSGAPIMCGLFPGNFLAEEILNDHEERPRALIVESSNPVHSLAEAAKLREAIRSLEFSMVIDIAMTETAMECDYVLPAATQYEKWEATFFPRSFPNNFFHLRAPLIEPPATVLTEPEIHTRIIDKLGVVEEKELSFLKLAAKGGRLAYTLAFLLQLTRKPKLGGLVAYVLYKTLGPTLPKGQASTAVVWGIAQIYAKKRAKQLARIGIKGLMAGNKLFQKIVASPSGTTIGISKYEDSFDDIPHPEKKIQLVIGELLEELDDLKAMKPLIETSKSYPFSLVAGSRRAYTANCAIRDPRWAKGKNVTALSIHPEDAEEYQIAEGANVMLTTEAGRTKVNVAFDDRMHRGTLSIPNGQGMQFTDDSGVSLKSGVFANELTSVKHRDKFVGTPLHKFVPANIAAI